MDIVPPFLDEREEEELDFEERDARPVAMPGTGAPVLQIGEGCFLTLPTNPD